MTSGLSLIEQNDRLRAVMEDMRRDIWREMGTYREEASDVNPHAYVNHTWLKKFGSFLFNFDAEFENKYLFAKPGKTIENEWCIDESGAFGPGTIPKKPRIGKTMPTPKMRTP